MRTAMLSELKQKKAEFDREMSFRQQKMQDELLERERLKEAEYVQNQLQLEEKYQHVGHLISFRRINRLYRKWRS